jgi:hypothetical protein
MIDCISVSGGVPLGEKTMGAQSRNVATKVDCNLWLRCCYKKLKMLQLHEKKPYGYERIIDIGIIDL